MPTCRWIAAVLCLILCPAAPQIVVAEESAAEAFPDYQPKLSADTLLDYRPSLRPEVEALPEPAPVSLRALLDALDHYRSAAAAAPGTWREGSIALGADPQEYAPSDAELLLAEVGDRIGLVAQGMPPAAFVAALGMLGRTAPLEYPRFVFRHVDVMGSGRFFYAGAAIPTQVPAGSGLPKAAVDIATLEAMALEQQAAYLAGAADGMAFATRWPADRLSLLATCMRGFTGEELGGIVRQFRSAGTSPDLPDADPAPLALALAMVDACQLQWTAPVEK